MARLAGGVLHFAARAAPRVCALHVRGLLVAVVGAVDARPRGPRVLRAARVGRAREELKVGEALAVHPEAGADAVGARVATANHHDVLALGVDLLAGPVRLERALAVGEERVLVAPQKLHREVHLRARKRSRAERGGRGRGAERAWRLR